MTDYEGVDMTNTTSSQPAVRGRYSEDERGYALDTLDQPVAQVAAHLGRTARAVSAMRVQVRSGYIPSQRVPWTALEDDIVRMGAKKTSAEIAKQLPGRTENTVKRRRFVLGAQAELKHKDPNRPGKRPLLAKTCKECGLLLPADWFKFHKAYAAKCKKCESDYASARPRNTAADLARDMARQELSLKTADRNKFEYTAADEIVLLDASKTTLEKAIALRRSFFAIRAALFARGIKNPKRLGDKEVDQWLIDNPNLGRIAEITASLRDEILEHGKIHPEWDWDDE